MLIWSVWSWLIWSGRSWLIWSVWSPCPFPPHLLAPLTPIRGLWPKVAGQHTPSTHFFNWSPPTGRDSSSKRTCLKFRVPGCRWAPFALCHLPGTCSRTWSRYNPACSPRWSTRFCPSGTSWNSTRFRWGLPATWPCWLCSESAEFWRARSFRPPLAILWWFFVFFLTPETHCTHLYGLSNNYCGTWKG